MAHKRYKLDDEMIEKLCQHIRAGNSYEGSAKACGIQKSTFFRWRRNGLDDIAAGNTDTLPARLYTATDIATGEWEASQIAVITRAGQGMRDKNGEWIERPQWQASAWQLERRRPETYGRQRVEITGRDGGAIEIGPPSLDGLPEEARNRVLHAIHAAREAQKTLEAGETDE